MNKKITIKEIAKISGFSKTTISRYYNGGYVKESTRHKIKEIVDKYNYKPNTFAKLKAKKSGLIAISVPCLDSYFVSKSLKSIDDVLKNNNYTIIVLSSNYNLKKEEENIRVLNSLNIDGMIVYASDKNDRYLDIFKEIKVPLVVMGQEYEEYISIINDDKNASLELLDEIDNSNFKEAIYFDLNIKDEAITGIRKGIILDFLKQKNIKTTIIKTNFNTLEIKEMIEKNKYVLDNKLIICSTTKQIIEFYRFIYKNKLKPNFKLIGFGAHKYLDILYPAPTLVLHDYLQAGVLAAKSIINSEKNKVYKTRYIIKKGSDVDE